MHLYFAPLEGITKFIYRNVHHEMFGGCDAYFAPFITPSDNEKIGIKALRDVLPENNAEVPLKIQVQTNQAASFLKFEDKLKKAGLGYDEVNINLGCPSGTVVKKGRGAGFLRDPDGLDRFLSEIFEKSSLKISVKTRTGFSDSSEMERLTEIYNRYPITLVTVHPRTRNEFYNGVPDKNVFRKVYETSQNPLCYNGNIFTVEEYRKIAEEFPKLDGVMLGRGAIANPAIFREIKGGAKLATHELLAFTEKLTEAYLQELKSEVYTLQKLKEVWMYMMWNYPEEKKIIKQVKKSKKISEFHHAIMCLPEIIR